MQIDTRFSNFEDLQIFDLFDDSKFKSYAKEFPRNLLDRLIKNYPSFFSKIKLENEIKVLYADPNIFARWDKLQVMYNFIYYNSLQQTVTEINKLLSLILSLPPTSASNKRDFPCVKRIKTYCRNTQFATSKQRRL
ncbi:unnamed protein product [Diabrotica balteata]|uniref:Uncharacterized protein n=1 Tax=Diabrotica balteata TaxID=107213 RepID=A0A9N9T8G2_DIABA|nr:unnamed protein product [Diabrotica balteata]